MEKQIRFGPREETGWLDVAGAGAEAHNVCLDGRGALRRRPGILAYSGAPSGVIDSDGIIGLHEVENGTLFALGDNVPARTIYKVTSGGAADITGGDSDKQLPGSGRPVFAETEALLVAAGGSELHKIELSTELPSRLGGSPPEASHVAVTALRLLANDLVVDRAKVNFSAIADGAVFTGHEVWPPAETAGFFSAEAKSDPVRAVYENTNEVWVFGTRNVQIFVPDPQFVFAPASTREYGLGAKYAVAGLEGEFAWLDHARRILVSDGRGFEVVSPPIQRVLTAMGTVSDAFAYRVFLDWLDALVFTFPTDGRTFVYQKGMGWSQWSGPGLSAFAVNCHHLAPGGRNLVGTTDGRVGILSHSAGDDLGQAVEAWVTTGFENHGTDHAKTCNSVRITMARGGGTADEKLLLSWRDDYGAWNPPIEVPVGEADDTDLVLSFGPLGSYRRRDWRLKFSGASELGVASVVEDFTVEEY